MGVVDSITPLKLTEEGRSAVQKRISERQGQTAEREGSIIEEKAVENFLSSHAQNIPGIMPKWKTYVQYYNSELKRSRVESEILAA